jgi:hypothetical protein
MYFKVSSKRLIEASALFDRAPALVDQLKSVRLRATEVVEDLLDKDIPFFVDVRTARHARTLPRNQG